MNDYFLMLPILVPSQICFEAYEYVLGSVEYMHMHFFTVYIILYIKFPQSDNYLQNNMLK